MGPAAGPPAAPLGTLEPWWSNEKTVLKVISAVGALIVIAGVGLLIVLAIESGLLGPLGRVTLAYALAVALAGAAVVVHNRDRANVGVTALAIASLSTAHLTTMSLVLWLEWWDSWFAVAVILAVTALAYAAARIRDSKALLITAGITGLVAALSVSDTGVRDNLQDALLMIILVIPVAMSLVWWGRHHEQNVSATAAVVFLLTAGLMYGLTYNTWIIFIVHPLLAIVLAAMTFLDRSFVLEAFTPITLPPLMRPGGPGGPGGPGVRLPIDPRPAGLSVPLPPRPRTHGYSSVNLGALGVLAWTTVPVMAVAGPDAPSALLIAVALGLIVGIVGLPVIPRPDFGWLTAESAARAGGFPMRTMKGSHDDPRMDILQMAGFITAALPAFLLAVRDLDTTWARIPVALIAAVIVWISVYKPSENGKAYVGVWTAAAIFGNWPAIVLTIFSPNYLREHGFWTSALAAQNVHLSGLLLGVIALGLLAMVVVHRNGAGAFEKICGLLGLVLTAVPVVTLLTAIGLRFSLAHMLVSIGWMVAAGWLMLAPKRLNVDSNLAGALVIAAAAVLKLVFYDMQAMHGITRVMAFLVCGIILLAMAVIRSRKDDAADEKARGSGGPAGPHGPSGPGGPDGPAGPHGPGGPGGPAGPHGPGSPGHPSPGHVTAGAPPAGHRPDPGGHRAPGPHPGHRSGTDANQNPGQGSGPAPRPNPGPGHAPGDGWGIPPSDGTPPRN